MIARVMLTPIPLKSQPRNVLADGIYVGCVFLDRVGVVKTKIDCASVFTGETKIDTNGLGMTNVQVAIGSVETRAHARREVQLSSRHRSAAE